MTIRKTWFLALAAALVVAAPVMAEKGDSKIRFGLQMISPTGDLFEDDGSERVSVEADSAVGPFFEYEYMVGDKAGIFANISLQNHDVDGSITDLGPGGMTLSGTIADLDVMPLEFGANFYVVRNDSWAFYLGPKVAYVMFGDLELTPAFLDPGDPDEISTDDDFGFGANFGLDAPFGESGWFFSANVQYLQFAVEIDEGSDTAELDIDPWVVKVGVGKKF